MNALSNSNYLTHCSIMGIYMEQVELLHDEFMRLVTDEDRMEWVILNREDDIYLLLDTENTFLMFNTQNDLSLPSFDSPIGVSDGLLSLLSKVGISFELA